MRTRGPERPQMGLQDELAAILNRASRENESDTPDYILAGYMVDCLRAFERAVRLREAWRDGAPLDQPAEGAPSVPAGRRAPNMAELEGAGLKYNVFRGACECTKCGSRWTITERRAQPEPRPAWWRCPSGCNAHLAPGETAEAQTSPGPAPAPPVAA